MDARGFTGLALRFGAVLAALACSLPLQAQVARSALIIGISAYADSEVPVLAGVPHDIDSARTVARAMGIADERITVLRDGQAHKAAILDALERLAAGAGEGGRVFVYFSGHGTRWFEPARQACREGLLTYDRQTVTDEEIAARTKRMNATADKLLVVFDACHSDGVSSHGGRSRATPVGGLTPKFFLKSDADSRACAKASNLVTRSLMLETTRLGGLRENFVQITSSRADEVSFDEAGKDGIATQAVRDCLLGRAADSDGSGAVSVDEVQACAQALVEQKLRPFPELRAQHITVTGNRNIVPMPAAPPPAPPTEAAASAAAPGTAAPPAAPMPPVTPAPQAAPAPPPATAWLAALRDVVAQHNPRRQVDVTLDRSTLKAGRDALSLTVRSSHAGYVYIALLGSDRQSLYLVFPNTLDRDNAIAAQQPLRLPRAGWKLQAQGPAGTNHLLVLVSDTPRRLDALGPPVAGSATPFSHVLSELAGRRALFDFFTGSGIAGASGSYGARLLSVQEMP